MKKSLEDGGSAPEWKRVSTLRRHRFLTFNSLFLSIVSSVSVCLHPVFLFFHVYTLLILPLQCVCLPLSPSIPLHSMQTVAAFVPLLFFHSLSSFCASSFPPLSSPWSLLSLYLSPLPSLLTRSLYCHSAYMLQTLLQWLSVLGIGTCSAADFHSSFLIRE